LFTFLSTRVYILYFCTTYSGLTVKIKLNRTESSSTSTHAVSTEMGDRSLVYRLGMLTSHSGQLSHLPSAEGEMSTCRGAMLCDPGGNRSLAMRHRLWYIRPRGQ